MLKEVLNENKTLLPQISVTSNKSDVEVSKTEVIKETENIKTKKKKAGGRLIMEEHIQTGKVKLNVLWSYFKACQLWFAIPFVIFYILANVSLLGSNIWLSDWSNEAKKGAIKKYSRNMRLLIFTFIGLGQGICQF